MRHLPDYMRVSALAISAAVGLSACEAGVTGTEVNRIAPSAIHPACVLFPSEDYAGRVVTADGATCPTWDEYQDEVQTSGNSAVGGAAAGAIVGGLINSEIAEGALIGAIAGGLVGAAAGVEAANAQRVEPQFLIAEIDNELANLSRQRQETVTQLSRMRAAERADGQDPYGALGGAAGTSNAQRVPTTSEGGVETSAESLIERIRSLDDQMERLRTTRRGLEDALSDERMFDALSRLHVEIRSEPSGADVRIGRSRSTTSIEGDILLSRLDSLSVIYNRRVCRLTPPGDDASGIIPARLDSHPSDPDACLITCTFPQQTPQGGSASVVTSDFCADHLLSILTSSN